MAHVHFVKINLSIAHHAEAVEDLLLVPLLEETVLSNNKSLMLIVITAEVLDNEIIL